jgi:hypothetical protein
MVTKVKVLWFVSCFPTLEQMSPFSQLTGSAITDTLYINVFFFFENLHQIWLTQFAESNHKKVGEIVISPLQSC